jgi:DNA repair exonuclease SbcCD ATPase subunit
VIVRCIDARFMRYTEPQKLHLPSKGLVLVGGPNGGGKSSILEAVSVGLWGETLRPTSPWREGEECRVIVAAVADGRELHVRRERSRSDRTTLEWAVDGAGAPVKYDTATKAQAALDPIVGPHEVWRRTHVFSSQGIGHFTRAKDSDRKRLLETLLGLERFDGALDGCRRDLRKVEADVAAKQRAVDIHGERVRGDKQRREQAEAELARLLPPADTAALAARIEELDAAAAKVQHEAQVCRDQAASINGKVMLGVESVKSAKRQLALVERGSCPTCEREWDYAELPIQRELVENAVRHESEARRGFEAELARLKATGEELAEEYRALSSERQRCLLEQGAARTVEGNRARLQTLLASAIATSDETEDALDDMLGELVLLKAKRAELGAVDDTLSLTGVRAQLLGDALDGIQRVANGWLGRIAGWGMRLELKPSSEKGPKDAISLQVHGAAGGRGYYGASDGEQRRIDVALLLALADVANASCGLSHGTLFFDEVFDALDSDGCEAVCDVLEELAHERPVVVISHNDEVSRRLSKTAVVRVHAAGGVLEVDDG